MMGLFAKNNLLEVFLHDPASCEEELQESSATRDIECITGEDQNNDEATEEAGSLGKATLISNILLCFW
ncbi:hypothetical protein R3I93_000118 [Phoxinus phoxinus]|uniref:Uncharacterized protein n=1 Tax=Phoxinus phoxinus TaxID=58324 RepID=A0AAN9DM22_9TELE